MKKICFFFFLLFSLQSFSQKVVLKNNLVYDALLTPNLSVEFSLGKKWTLDTQIGMNFFFYENDATANGYKTKKWSHWLVQPEIRYWICETFNGWFLGLHAHGGQIRLPGIGGLIAPGQGLFPKYTEGKYEENGTTLVVSRGIGNSVLPLRVNDRPQIVVVQLACNYRM